MPVQFVTGYGAQLHGAGADCFDARPGCMALPAAAQAGAMARRHTFVPGLLQSSDRRSALGIATDCTPTIGRLNQKRLYRALLTQY